jgi:hypothetical protein
MSRQVVYDRGQALSTINGILKDDYVLNDIHDVVNNSTYLFSQLKSTESTHGRQYILPLKFGTSQGVGARGENGDLPAPGFGEYEQALGNVKHIYSTFYITGQAIHATRGNKASFKDALKTALQDCRDGLVWDLHRQAWSAGTGVLGTVQTTAASTTTIAVTNPYGLAYVAGDLDASEKIRPFRRNMRIRVGAAAFTTVTGVNAAGTITVNPAVSVTAGDTIIRADSATSSSGSNEMTGISGLVQSTGSYLGIARAGRPEWQSNLIQLGSGSGGPITEEAMRIALDTGDINGTAPAGVIFTNHKTRRRYEKLLQGQKRFVNPMKLEGGHTALEFDGIPVVVDKDAPPQRMWFLRLEDIMWMQMADIQWMEEDGAVLKKVAGKDAYEAVLFTYRDLVTKSPANQTCLFDITG